MTSCTVLMPVYNGAAMVRRTLTYLLWSGIEPQSVFVMDDASTEGSMNDVRGWAESLGVRWIRHPVNLGYTRNVNRGLSAVVTDTVLVVNSDCFVSASALQGLIRVLEQFDILGCVGPLSSKASHQTVNLQREILWEALGNDEIRFFCDAVESRLVSEFGVRPWMTPTVNGFCCLWRMSSLREIEFFDEAEFPRGYGEEDDACLRLIDTGRFPAIVPCVFVPHLKTQSFETKERHALKELAQHKLRIKFSNQTIDQLVRTLEKNPRLLELKRITIGS